MKTYFLFVLAAILIFPGTFTGKAWGADAKTDASMVEVLNHYLNIQEKLASDTPAGVEAEAQAIVNALAPIAGKPCPANDNACALMVKINGTASAVKGNDLEALRKSFIGLSKAMMDYRQQLKPNWPSTFAFECPMANAQWIQRTNSLKNPYYGKAMLTCGEAL